jgi:hypothetical protein
MSLSGVKRTWLVAAHMSAFDPKRTSAVEDFLQCKLNIELRFADRKFLL